MHRFDFPPNDVAPSHLLYFDCNRPNLALPPGLLNLPDFFFHFFPGEKSSDIFLDFHRFFINYDEPGVIEGIQDLPFNKLLFKQVLHAKDCSYELLDFKNTFP